VKKAKYKNHAKDPKIPEDVAIKIIDKAKVEDMNDIQATPTPRASRTQTADLARTRLSACALVCAPRPIASAISTAA
jgi:hypothetical protein